MTISSVNPKANTNNSLYTEEMKKLTQQFLQRKEVVKEDEDAGSISKHCRNKSGVKENGKD